MRLSYSFPLSILFLVAAVGIRSSHADALPEVSCFPNSPVTAIPVCNAFNNKTEACGKLGSAGEQKACLCNQAVFNQIFE